MLLPLASAFRAGRALRGAGRAPLPMRKRLWQQIVCAKIKSQAAVLVELHGDDNGLAVLAAARPLRRSEERGGPRGRRYWPRLFADLNFRRHRENEDQNILLNYGYAVLRAIVARRSSPPGLHPLARASTTTTATTPSALPTT